MLWLTLAMDIITTLGCLFCQHPGFTYSVRLRAGAVHSVELVVTNESHGLVFMDATHTDGHVSAGSIAYLQSGDDVYIRIKGTGCGNSGAIFSDYCGRSSFIGWKIF